MKRQEKRRRKAIKQKEEARNLRKVTAVLLGVHPSQAGKVIGHLFKPVNQMTSREIDDMRKNAIHKAITRAKELGI